MCRGRSFGHPVRTDLRQARYVEGAELAGKGHRAVRAARLLLLHATAALLLLLHATAALLLLLHATDMVLAGVKNLCDTVDLDREPPGTREDCVPHSVLPADRARNAEVGRPPGGRGGNIAVVASSWANSPHSASTRALSALSNMLPPTIVIPPCIHWPDPPSSGIENWAMVPPPRCIANSIESTASRESPWRRAMSAMALSTSGLTVAFIIVDLSSSVPI